jgi:hypothetical protein
VVSEKSAEQASMSHQKLLDYIRHQTAMGTKREDIQRFLVSSGWTQPDMDAAFAAVASEPVRKRSIIARIFRGIFWALGIIVLLAMIGGSFLAYYVLNQAKSNIESGRATESEKSLYASINSVLIQGALVGFNAKNKKYPTSLDELVPKYIKELPTDPSTNLPFRYLITEGAAGYNLCTVKNGQDVCATASTTIDGTLLDY